MRSSIAGSSTGLPAQERELNYSNSAVYQAGVEQYFSDLHRLLDEFVNTPALLFQQEPQVRHRILKICLESCIYGFGSESTPETFALAMRVLQVFIRLIEESQRTHRLSDFITEILGLGFDISWPLPEPNSHAVFLNWLLSLCDCNLVLTLLRHGVNISRHPHVLRLVDGRMPLEKPLENLPNQVVTTISPLTASQLFCTIASMSQIQEAIAIGLNFGEFQGVLLHPLFYAVVFRRHDILHNFFTNSLYSQYLRDFACDTYTVNMCRTYIQHNEPVTQELKSFLNSLLMIYPNSPLSELRNLIAS